MGPKQGSYLYTSDVDEAVVPLRATLIAHLGRHPDNDYVRVCYVAKGWIGVHRTLAKRQLVMVQRVNYITTAGFMHMATAVNLHIVRPIALYKCDGISHVAFEYVELDMLEILPLSEVEAAAFMLQVMNAVRYLTSFFIFQIDSIRVSSKGVVKIGKALQPAAPSRAKFSQFSTTASNQYKISRYRWQMLLTWQSTWKRPSLLCCRT